MEVQINVPSTLNEIPLKHYQDFLKVQRDSTDEEFVAQKINRSSQDKAHFTQ